MNDGREAQIRSLLPLVRTIARRVRGLVRSVDLDDLIGDGSVGLIRAVDNFDPERGPSLEHYARQLIVGSMLNGIRRMDPVSERARRAVRDGEAERYRIAVERGEIPSLEEMENRKPGFLRATLAAYRSQPLSLDTPLPDGESLVRDWAADPGAIVSEREELRTLRDWIRRLPPRERDLIARHYHGGRSLREIARHMSISPQRASQLHLAAMSRLRKAVHAAAR